MNGSPWSLQPLDTRPQSFERCGRFARALVRPPVSAIQDDELGSDPLGETLSPLEGNVWVLPPPDDRGRKFNAFELRLPFLPDPDSGPVELENALLVTGHEPGVAACVALGHSV